MLVFQTRNRKSKAVILEVVQSDATLVIHEINLDFLIEQANRQTKQLDVPFVGAWGRVVHLVFVFFQAVAVAIVLTVELAVDVRFVRILPDARQEGEDADPGEIREGLDQFERLIQRHDSMHDHDLADPHKHRVVELLLDDGYVVVFADTCQFDAKLAVGVQVALAVRLHILVVGRDNLGDDFLVANLALQIFFEHRRIQNQADVVLLLVFLQDLLDLLLVEHRRH